MRVTRCVPPRSSRRASSASGNGDSPAAWRAAAAASGGLAQRTTSSSNASVAPLSPITDSTSPALMPNSQCSWNNSFLVTAENTSRGRPRIVNENAYRIRCGPTRTAHP